MDSALNRIARLPRRKTAAWRAPALLAATALLVGCSTSRSYVVDVDADIPQPLIAPAPYRVAIYYPPQLANVVTNEQSLLGDTWQVNFGDLQLRYFQTMLGRSFRDIVPIEADTLELALAELRNGSVNVDFMVAPRIDNFAFLTPGESGTKFFAVSMRHYVDFYSASGNPLLLWEINSYGRSRSTFAASQSRLANEACQDALRDMAASVVVGIPNQLVAIGIAPTPEDIPEVN
jgi:hypothetical protein